MHSAQQRRVVFGQDAALEAPFALDEKQPKKPMMFGVNDDDLLAEVARPTVPLKSILREKQAGHREARRLD